VLLNLYRYEVDTRNELIKILRKIDELDRLWIPHQAALEYYKNRGGVIKELENSYDKVKTDLKTNNDKLKKDLDKYTRHPILNIKDLVDKLNENRKIIEDELDKLKKNHPNWDDDDEIQTTLEELFDGKVGPHYSKGKLEEIYRLGELRYKLKIPPGYKLSIIHI